MTLAMMDVDMIDEMITNFLGNLSINLVECVTPHENFLETTAQIEAKERID